MEKFGMFALLGIVIVSLGVFIVLFPNFQFQTAGQEVKQFYSYQDLKNFINSSLSEYGGGFYGDIATGAVAQRLALPSATTAEGVSPSQPVSGGSEDYSQTNIQVSGVDEADIVKNDGRYVYTVSGNKVVIVDAYPPENARILSEINISGTPLQIFVNNNKLVVFASTYSNVPIPLGVEPAVSGGSGSSDVATQIAPALPSIGESILPYPYYYSTQTFIGVYDISDRSNPVLARNLTVDGDYIDSRMIGDYIYPITGSSINLIQGEIPLPRIYSGSVVKTLVEFPNVYYFDNPDYSYRFTTIMAVNTQNDAEEPATKTYVMGYTQNIFVSLNNIYITYTKYLTQSYIYNKLIDEVLIPSVPSNVAAEITAIRNSNIPSYQKYQDVQEVFNNYLQGLNPEQQAVLLRNIENKTQDFYIEIAKEMEKTVVHKIAISGNSIEYKTAGEVPGNVLNQFSMDEFNNYFRIATTTGQISRAGEPTSANHVYVLDGNLNIVGKLEDLAPRERIYSARFIGDRGYLVTFKKIDPFFVIDLKDPNNPQVLGYLKIPGFSDYLHPYDENHVIGIGKETTEGEGGNFAWFQGVKLSLFDVTDVSNPKEISRYNIGDRGTDSYALNDHKAFLFSREKNLLVIPILLAEIDETKYSGEVPNWAYGDYVWQGAYVFNLDLDNGFTLKGSISHNDTESLESFYYYSPFSIKRSLYIGNTLYTVSDEMIKMNSLADLNEQNKIELPYNFPEYYYPGPIPLPVVR